MTIRRMFNGVGRSKVYPCAKCGAPNAGRSKQALCPEHRAESRRAAKARFYREDAAARSARYRENRRAKLARAKRVKQIVDGTDPDIALYRAEKAKRDDRVEHAFEQARLQLHALEIDTAPKRGRPRKENAAA